MRSFHQFLMIFIIAFIGTDRINLLPQNYLEIILTPYLFLSTLFILYTLVIRFKKIDLSWIMKDYKLVFILFSFFIFLSLSIFMSIDIYFSFKRFILFLMIISVFILFFSSYNYKDIEKTLYYGSIIGSIIFYIFNFLLFTVWLDFFQISSLFINLEPDTLSYFIPRLGGFSDDVNRGGFVLMFFTYILTISPRISLFKSILISLNIFFIFCTLSRTAIIFLIISFFLYYIFYVSSNLKKNFIIIFFLSFLFFSVTILYLSNQNIIKIDDVIEERLSLQNKNHDSSASIHFKLISDAVETIFSDGKIFFFGIGHGTSYRLIEGYRMSLNKYANYHSQYLSIFVENGFFAFISFLIITFIYPFYYRRNILFPLIIGVFIFNIFYQLLNEPTFWLIIFLFYYLNHNKHNNQ